MSRRELVLASGTLFAWAYWPKLARAEGRDPRLLVIVLRGALDGLAAVAPVGDPSWVGLRGDHALTLDGTTPALPLDSFFALQRFYAEGDREIPPGRHQVRMEFAYDGGGLGKGGHVTLYVDGEKAGDGRVEATVPMAFSADETSMSAATLPPLSATTTPPRAASSPAPSTGSKSTSTRPPRTSTT